MAIHGRENLRVEDRAEEINISAKENVESKKTQEIWDTMERLNL